MIADLLIVGGGAIGLSLADCALRNGLRVTLIDKGPLGQEASWAGAGMLTCRPRLNRNPGSTDYHDLCLLSVKLHAQWSQRLLADTGIDIGYRVCGALELMFRSNDPAEYADLLENIVPGSNARGIPAIVLSQSEARNLEPALSVEVSGAVHFPGEAQVRNPRFLKALIKNVQRLGGELIENRAVADIDVTAGRVAGVKLVDGTVLHVGAVAVCAGAWTSQLARVVKLAPASAKISPVRGQLLAYKLDPKIAARLLTAGNHYIVPRGDGVLLVGATHENVGFEKAATAEGEAELTQFGHRILPILKESRPVQSWSGLRPGLKGRHPLLGAVPGVQGLFISAGHYRNGLTLAPASAELLVDTILGRSPQISVENWTPREV